MENIAANGIPATGKAKEPELKKTSKVTFLGTPGQIEQADTTPYVDTGEDIFAAHERRSEPDEESHRGRHGHRRDAQNALDALLAGNKRFCGGEGFQRCLPDLELLEELRDEQQPNAVVLGCSDARVPPELVFDQGLGDIFVVRVAGHVVNDFVLGSILNAVQMMGSRLVVVLGHTRCFMIARALHYWAQKEEDKEAYARDLPGANLRTDSKPQVGKPSPFAAVAATPTPSSGSFLTRMCSCGGKPETRESPAFTPGRRRSGVDHNPMLSMMNDVVQSVEATAKRNASKLKDITEKVRLGDKRRGGGGALGLRTADSMEITRARMVHAKESDRRRQIDEISLMQGVEEVIEENTIRSAKAVLKGLVRHVDVAIMEEVLVVSAKYDLDSGRVTTLGTMWVEYQGSQASYVYK